MIANSIARTTLSVVPWPLAVENLEADEARVRRHADKLAADQPGDVRAVTVLVVRRYGSNVALGEIVERGDAVAEVDARLDAGVDDRDANAVAGIRRAA